MQRRSQSAFVHSTSHEVSADGDSHGNNEQFRAPSDPNPAANTIGWRTGRWRLLGHHVDVGFGIQRFATRPEHEGPGRHQPERAGLSRFESKCSTGPDCGPGHERSGHAERHGDSVREQRTGCRDSIHPAGWVLADSDRSSRSLPRGVLELQLDQDRLGEQPRWHVGAVPHWIDSGQFQPLRKGERIG